MSYASEYKYWLGTEWTCPRCDEALEPFEDSNLCEDCATGHCIGCGFLIEDWEYEYSAELCSVCSAFIQ